MKTCSKCKTEKPLVEFTKNKAKKDGHNGYCKKCQAKYLKEHYQKNPAYYKKKARKREALLYEWYHDYKASLQCSKCGENHPVCIEFHHNDPNEKSWCVCDGIRMGVGIKRIKEEIAKCTVFCRNCHSKHHYEEKYGVYMPDECDG